MSLRLRLALWCGALLCPTIVLVCLFGYAVHSRAHYDDLDNLLEGTAAHAGDEYAIAASPEERAAIFLVPVAAGVAARVYDAAGQVVAAGPNAALAPPVDPRAVLAGPTESPFEGLVGLVPRIAPPRQAPGVFGMARGAAGDRWRLYVLPLVQQSQYLLVAAPLEGLDRTLEWFRRLMALLGATGLVMTLVGSWLVAGRALRPVAALTATAEAIARSGSFERRVQVDNSHDELGRLGTTFNEMLAALEHVYQAQQRFVSDASHELRAPLTAIQANLQLLERQPEMPPAERQEAVREASREAGRLARLVADLLALARADAGVQLRRHRLELDRVLLETLSEVRHIAQGQRIAIAALEPALVEGDPDRLKQLFLILLDNALKYTPAAGHIDVALRRTGGSAEVVVQDSGVGIPPDALPQVFERFYRADPARTRDPGGTGLGLPIARWIAREHGGDVTLASEPGRGTMATVRLPLIH